MFERFTTGPTATILGALLLVVGGIAVVAHAQIVGTVIAAVGGLLVVRERIRQRSADD
jgi:drug/metabolite transporter superfamily protein YnfA